MQIEFKLGTYRATGVDVDPAVMKRAGWIWFPRMQMFTTSQVSRVAPFVDYCVGEALQRVKPFVDKRRADIAESVAATADIVVPVGAVAKALGKDYYGYQKAGIAFMRARHKSLNGDVRRLGKMIQGIGVCNTYPVGELRSVLVMCPANAKITWVERWREWSIHHPALSSGHVSGTKINPQTDFLVVNWDMVTAHIGYIMQQSWDIVIGDEIHRLGNSESRRTKAVFGEDGRSGIPARLHWMGLSGNPLGTRPRNLWPIVKYMDPIDLGANQWRFKGRYCDAGKFNGWDDTGASNMEELQYKLRKSIMIRRDKHDVSEELPPRREIVHLPKDGLSKHLKAERSALQMALDAFRENVKAGAPQAAHQEPEDEELGLSGPQQLTLAALPMMVDFINEALEDDGKIVVACHNRAVAFALRDAFEGCAFVVGGIGDRAREAERVRFQTDPRCRVFVGNIDACCENMDLSAADTVIYCQRVWQPWKLDQMDDRIWFVGKNKPLWICHLVVEDSVDSEMAALLTEAQDAIERATVASRLNEMPS